MTIRRVQVGMLSGLRRTPVVDLWPTCLTCHIEDPFGDLVPKPVDAMSFVEKGKCYAKVLVKCHNAEQLATFDMGTEEWTHETLGKMLTRHNWFDPTHDANTVEER